MPDSAKAFFIVIIGLSLLLLGGYVHEGDIQRACKKEGKSGLSTWRGEIKCSPLKNDD